MDQLKNYYKEMGVEEKVFDYAQEVEKGLKDRFEKLDAIAQLNQIKVLNAMQKHQIAEMHLGGTTGYGYNDSGREAVEALYADVFGTEDALVRPQITCGTHALGLALSANLRPGDEILAISGKPYDTLEEVIGIRESKGSLKEYGITYAQVDLLEDGSFDLEGIKNAINDKTKLIHIQRSKGYATRPTLSVDVIGEAIAFVKEINKDLIVMVDNCYGEFVEKSEPTQVGADLIAGSMIKNAGGGIATTGGYIAGRKDLVEKCAYRLTTPGLGSEVGATIGMNRQLYMGLFFAPHTVGEALKSAVYISALYESFGYDVTPRYNEIRHDIVQSLGLENAESLVAFCQGIQSGSPIDSYLLPEPWDMPGYDSKVVMAAGAFTLGSSIELSADAPIREPYYAWIQGGLNFHSAKLCALLAAQQMEDKGLLK